MLRCNTSSPTENRMPGSATEHRRIGGAPRRLQHLERMNWGQCTRRGVFECGSMKITSDHLRNPSTRVSWAQPYLESFASNPAAPQSEPRKGAQS